MVVQEVMQPEVLETYPGEPLDEAARRMQDHSVGALMILDGDLLVAVITERDLLRAMAGGAEPGSTPVGDYMTADPVVARPDMDVEAAARLMVEHQTRHLPVVDAGRVVGMVSARDLLVAEGWPQRPLPGRG